MRKGEAGEGILWERQERKGAREGEMGKEREKQGTTEDVSQKGRLHNFTHTSKTRSEQRETIKDETSWQITRNVCSICWLQS